MARRFSLLLAVMALHGSYQGPPIIGTWRGTSTCVDHARFPACTDEQAVYEIRAHPTARDSVVVQGDKVVNGVRETMGDITFGRASDSTWIGQFGNRRGQSRWTLRVSGDRISGQLVDVQTGYRVRQLELTRQR